MGEADTSQCFRGPKAAAAHVAMSESLQKLNTRRSLFTRGKSTHGLVSQFVTATHGNYGFLEIKKSGMYASSLFPINMRSMAWEQRGRRPHACSLLYR